MPPKPKLPPGVTPCDKCPIRKLDGFRRFTPEELAFMMDFKSGELVVEPGTTILSEGSDGPHLYTVLSGWVFKYKTLEDGRRQVTNFGLPGDLIGLQASMFEAMTHSVEALTDVTLCILPRAKIWPLYKNFEGLAFDVTWLAAHEEVMLTDYLATVGQRNSAERVVVRAAGSVPSRATVGNSEEGRIETADHTASSGRYDRILPRAHQQGAAEAAAYGVLQLDELDVRHARRRQVGRDRHGVGPARAVRPFL
ncbi:MAG: Crp/Fnr family transcriptional regulator [Sphingomonadales bacterium]|nr:Crp/Fnr family transcriptional regulator [Sphingomonadales bacterium]